MSDLENISLECILDELIKYGEPGIYFRSRKWACYVNLNTGVKGFDSKCGSGLNFSTPQAAAMDCLTKLKNGMDFLAESVGVVKLIKND